MRECLECKKEYENQRETSKFCSTKCRVKHNRKSQKTKSKIQMDVLYNAILDMVTNMPKNTPMSEMASKAVYNHPIYKPASGKTFAQYQQAKIDCETVEQWNELEREIANDTSLSSKLKNLLLNKR